MSNQKKLLFLPGDGIGAEVMSQVKRVIDWMDQKRSVNFDIQGMALVRSFAFNNLMT